MVNSTLTLWIIREKNLVKSLGDIFISVAFLIFLLINIDVPLLFLAVNVLYFSIPDKTFVTIESTVHLPVSSPADTL